MFSGFFKARVSAKNWMQLNCISFKAWNACVSDFATSTQCNYKQAEGEGVTDPIHVIELRELGRSLSYSLSSTCDLDWLSLGQEEAY